MVTKEQANDLFMQLQSHEKSVVLNYLKSFRQTYIFYNMSDPVPIVFYKSNIEFFENDKEINKFCNIDDSYTFIVNAVYYLSRYIIKSQRTT